MKVGYGQPYWSNCVCLQTYQQRMGSNLFNIVGTSPIWSGGVTQNVNGVLFGGSTTNFTPLPPMPTNFTVVCHYRYTPVQAAAWYIRGGGTPVWTLKDTNLQSTVTLAQAGGGQNTTLGSQTNAAAATTWQELSWPYPDNLDIDLLKPQQSLYNTIVRQGLANTSSNFFYLNSVLGQISGGNSVQAVDTNVVNALILGWDSTVVGLKPELLEVDSIAVFNIPLTSNQVASAYRALSWLVPGNSFDLCVGDSRMSEQGYNWGGVPYFDDWPLLYYQNEPTRQYYNASAAGTTTRMATNFGSMGIITNLPTRKYTDIEVSSDFGVNDLYINAAATGEIESNLVFLLTPAKNFGARIGWMSLYDVAVSNSVWGSAAYSLTYLGQQQAVNYWARTNSFFDDYWPAGEFITQKMLATNNPMLLTLDGVHFGYTSSNTYMPSRLANIYRARSKPWSSVWNTNGLTYLFIDPTNAPANGNTIRTDGTNWYFAN
jgi:hypothetical protein